MARTATALLLLAALLLVAGHAHAQGVEFPNYDDDLVLAPNTTESGLNLVPSFDGVGDFAGRTLNDSQATGPFSLLNDVIDPSGWRDLFTTTDTTGDTVNGLAGAVSIANKVTDTLQDKYMWLADTAGSTVYKIDTTLTGTASVVGEYAARPSASAGNPVAFAVLSNGDAFVGNAFTFATNEIGSLTKIQADSSSCGGATSSGLGDVLGWTSTVTGPVQTLVGGLLTTVTGLVGSLSDNLDACVKDWVDLSQVDSNANDVSIAAVGADGYDRVYTLAVNEQTRFQGYMKIYRTNTDGSQELLLDQYQDPNRVINTAPVTGTVVTATSDGPGAPGGSGLVIDKWGYLWSGGGTYIKNFGGSIGRSYMLVRMDTTNPGTIQYFPVPHETNALAFDNNGNLWVSGASGLSLVNIDPAVIGATYAPDSAGITTLLTPGGSPIDLIAAQGGTSSAVCQLDNCCEQGNYNTGLAVTRATGDVYVANECPTGKVLRFSSAGAAIGSPIDIGSYPSGINTDSSDNIWVPILVTTGANATEARATQLMQIAAGTNTATDVAALSSPYLGGIGDMTGRYTAQPPQVGSYSWVHDTNYPGYDKWDGGQAKWSANNLTTFLGFNNPSLTVTASVADDLLGPWSNFTVAVGSNWTSLAGMPPGQYIKFDAEFIRGDKQAPEIGPQSFGLIPLLTEFHVIPRNNYPTALCQPQYVFADNPTNQLDSTFGDNDEGRVCGAVLSAATAVDAGSHDPDTAELDSIVPIQPTSAFYSPSLYALVSATQQWTLNTLTVTDAHGGVNQCSERVNIQDITPPVWKSQYNLANLTNPLSGALSDISTLCIWPPNFKYYCWLDVTSNKNDQVVPLYDNCGGSIPIGKQVDGFVCEDSDPRTQPGDCVLYQQGTGDSATYNLCVLAQRRTVYTNTARVYQANFKVTDGSAPTVDVANTYSRQVKVPPLWNFQTSGDCPRPTYKAPAGTSVYYTNAARKK